MILCDHKNRDDSPNKMHVSIGVGINILKYIVKSDSGLVHWIKHPLRKNMYWDVTL